MPNESQSVEGVVKHETIQLSRLRLLHRLPRFVETLQCEQEICEISIWTNTIRGETKALAIDPDCLFVLPLLGVRGAQPEISPIITRVARNPLLIRLRSL